MLPDGESISAYTTGIVPFGGVCPAAITRTCSDGILSNTGDYGSCVVASPSNCSTPWGTTIAHGASVDAYTSSVATYGSACNKETRVCNNGVLSGSAAYSACAVASPASCTTPWGVSVSHGSSISAYEASSVAYGNTCKNESRTCDNGTFSGTYEYGTCSVASPASCTTPWGAVVAHGASTTAYLESATVTSCSSQTRTCNNGTLSGTYAYGSCSVVTPTYGSPGSLTTSCSRGGAAASCYLVSDPGSSLAWGMRWMIVAAKLSSGVYAFKPTMEGLSSPITYRASPTSDTLTCNTTLPAGYKGYNGVWLPVTFACTSTGFSITATGTGCGALSSGQYAPDQCVISGTWPAGAAYAYP